MVEEGLSIPLLLLSLLPQEVTPTSVMGHTKSQTRGVDGKSARSLALHSIASRSCIRFGSVRLPSSLQKSWVQEGLMPSSPSQCMGNQV